MKYGFIGFGHLAKAIYQGLKSELIDFGYFSKDNDFTEIPFFDSIPELVRFADIIWICVKPQGMVPVLEKLRGTSLGDKMIVSPVAGKTIRFIESYLGGETTIARIMPNLAVATRESVTAYADNSETELTQRVQEDLKKLGMLVDLEERYFDLFTALFGSGPAFLMEILNILKWKTGELGVSEDMANKMLAQLVRGTMSHLEVNPQIGLPELIAQIASKGGTTEAGLIHFNKEGIAERLAHVIDAAKNRSKELNE